MREIVRQALILAGKDTKLFLRDRFGLAFALLLPLLFVVGFTIAMSDLAPEDEQLRLAVVTEEEGGFSRQLIDSLTSSETVGVDEWNPRDAGLALDEERIPGYVLFPADFTQRIFSGESAEILVVTSDGDPETEAVLSGLARGVASRIQTLSLAARGATELGGFGMLDAGAIETFAAQPPLVALSFERVGDLDPFNVTDFTLPGYLTMFVFFVAALGAESIARERQTQTLERLLSTGVRRSSIVLGKFLGGAYRGFLQLSILWTVGIFAFNIDFGHSPATVIVVSVFFVLASASFGVMLASLARTIRSAGSMAVLASLTLAPVGGSWWPLFVAPEWLQLLGKLTPHGWANDAFNKLMLFGARPEDVLLHTAALAAFALVFFAVALARFRLAPAN